METTTQEEWLETIAEELSRARVLFPNFHSGHEGYAVIKEELDELWEDVRKDNIAGARAEAIQVAAMAVRFIMDLEGS